MSPTTGGAPSVDSWVEAPAEDLRAIELIPLRSNAVAAVVAVWRVPKSNRLESVSVLVIVTALEKDAALVRVAWLEAVSALVTVTGPPHDEPPALLLTAVLTICRGRRFQLYPILCLPCPFLAGGAWLCDCLPYWSPLGSRVLSRQNHKLGVDHRLPVPLGRRLPRLRRNRLARCQV